MRKEKLLKVLLAPHVSEKAASSASQYVFKVARTANKHEIKNAVEQLFQVNVKDVNVTNVKGAATIKQGRSVGRRSTWKKAYIVLQAGQEINIA